MVRCLFLWSKSSWLRESDLNQRPSGYEPEPETRIALKVKLYSGFKILTCKNTCKSCESVSVSSVSCGYTTIAYRNANLSAIAEFDQGHGVDHEAAFQEYPDRLGPFVDEVQKKAVSFGMALMFPSNDAKIAERNRKLSEGTRNP